MEFIKSNIWLIGLALGSGLMLLLPSMKKSAGGVPNLSPAESVTLINRSHAVVLDVRDEAELEGTIHDKTVLLREVHHRVKNNLQIISSLLSMQQRALSDPQAKAAVGDTRQRISALALIYRTLYQSDDLRYAEFTHNWSGIVVILLGACWLVQSVGRGAAMTSVRAVPA